MPQTVTGVIARSKGAPVELADIVIPAPGPGEAVVRVAACGACHTDLHYGEVEQAFERMHAGEVLRSVVVL